MDLVSPTVWVLTLLLTKAIEKNGEKLGEKAAGLLGGLTATIGEQLPAGAAQRLNEQPEELILNPGAIAEVEAVVQESPAVMRDIQNLSAEVNRDLNLVLAIEQLFQTYQQVPTMQPLWLKGDGSGGTIEQQILQQLSGLKWELQHPPTAVADLSFPDGVVSIGSSFYVERGDVQRQCEQAISQPKGLLRIKAPPQMGKTSCLERLVAYAQGLNYRVVRIDLRQADLPALQNLDQLLQWFCRQLCKQLYLQIDVHDKWNVHDGSKENCTNFVERYILGRSEKPLLLCIDNLERIFGYPDIFDDFLSLLRSWYEQQGEVWQVLRLVLLYVWHQESLEINFSPFGVGVEQRLPEFNAVQVQDLTVLYGLDWQDRQIADLMGLVGGHPYLVRLALYEVAQRKIMLQNLLATADQEDGLYGHHLKRRFRYLDPQPELKRIMQQVVHSIQPVFISSTLLPQLIDSGLIKYSGSDIVEPANQLYRAYFRKRL